LLFGCTVLYVMALANTSQPKTAADGKRASKQNAELTYVSQNSYLIPVEGRFAGKTMTRDSKNSNVTPANTGHADSMLTTEFNVKLTATPLHKFSSSACVAAHYATYATL